MYKKIALISALTILFVFVRLINPFHTHFAGDLNFSYPDEIDDQIRLPQMWGVRGAEGFGENTSFILWAYPLTFVLSFLTKITGSYNLVIIVFGYIASILLSMYSIKKLTAKLTLSRSSTYASITLYVVNTYFILLLDGGQVSIALAYGFFPLVVLKVFDSYHNQRSQVEAGFFVAILGFLEIRYIFILLIVILVKFLVFDFSFDFKKLVKQTSNLISKGITIVFVFVLLHFYWILPSVLSKLPSLPEGHGSLSGLSNLSFTTYGHSLLLMQPHWYKNVFGKISELSWQFYLLPIMVFFVPILFKKSRNVAFWLIIALTGLFLTKGSNPPIGDLYSWLFTHVPGFSFFRDSTKFFVLTAISYSVLLGYLFTKIESYLKPKQYVFVFSLFSLYLIFLANPVWLGKIIGTFSKNPYEEEYKEVATKLSADNEFGRVLWLPSKPSLGYSSPNHSSTEASRVFDKRPFATSVVGSYEVFNFIREGEAMGELFDVFGIKYIGYPYPDERREELKQDNVDYYHAFWDQVSNLSWVEKNISDFPIPLLKTKSKSERFFIADNTWAVIGSDEVYEEFVDKKRGSLRDNALVFAEDFYDVRNMLKHDETGILIYDLAGTVYGPDGDESFYGYEKPLFLSNILPFDPDFRGWWKRENIDYLWLRNFLHEKYGIDYREFTKGDGVAIAEGQKELTISTNQLGPADYLFGRVLLSSRGGKISFYQGDKLISEVKTKIDKPEKVSVKLTGYGEIPNQVFEYEKSEFYTNQMGRIDKSYPTLTIRTEGDINIINFVSTTSYETIHDQNVLHGDKYTSGKFLNWNNLSDHEKNDLFKDRGEVEINYKRIAPTKYKVNISGIGKGSTLVFSEKYDEYWRARNSTTNASTKSYPVYSKLNGFYIEKDGEYEIYYLPQKYVPLSFSISVVGLVAIVGYVALTRKRRR